MKWSEKAGKFLVYKNELGLTCFKMKNKNKMVKIAWKTLLVYGLKPGEHRFR